MTLRHHHRRMREHHSFAVRFAYMNFVVNAVMTVVWAGPVMALIFVDPSLSRSVAFVSFLSVWALLATHAGAAMAAYAAVHAAEDNTREPPSGVANL